ncbi:MAG: MerR family transcriptional regulator [Actinomycetota bacterium]|nr:MerR family transcriptional regulator [Actinomycetota bacterium]MDQ6945822.1 MerR family transcriptional regulator [Actinomycetota bacterium]
MERTSGALRIGELSHRTGVGVPALRAWESRYRLLRPSRTAGGQRLYSAEDEARVRQVQRLVSEGVAVGAAARWVAEDERAISSAETILGGNDGAWGERRLAATTIPQSAVATIPHRARLSAESGEAEFLALIHDTTRAIIHAATPADVVAVLAGFVRRSGGSMVDAQIDDAVLPVDLSFGEGPPTLPRAEPMSVARMALEQALPTLVEDARRLIDLLRRAEARGRTI